MVKQDKAEAATALYYKKMALMAKVDKPLYALTNLVHGMVILAGCGSTHEIERDKEMCKAMDRVKTVETVADGNLGVMVTLQGGRRYLVKVTEVGTDDD